MADHLSQVRRAATRSLKLGDDKESLEMKVRFTKAEASAERLWRSRMNDLLSQGLIPIYMFRKVNGTESEIRSDGSPNK